jgi:hypothetical protein
VAQNANSRPLVTTLVLNIPPNDRKLNVLVLACQFSNVALAKDVVGIVIREGPELINSCTSSRNRPLHYLAMMGRTQILETLVKHGSQPC